MEIAVSMAIKQVTLDTDLADIYGVTTKQLNEQAKRHCDPFPEDLMFQLTEKREEFDALRENPAGEWHRLEEREGTVPDLRTERNGVVESGLSPAKGNAASFAAEFGGGAWGYLADWFMRINLRRKDFKYVS